MNKREKEIYNSWSVVKKKEYLKVRSAIWDVPNLLVMLIGAICFLPLGFELGSVVLS